MSELDALLKRLQQEKRIVRWEPNNHGDKGRVIYVRKELCDAVSNINHYWLGQLQNEFDEFCSGRTITVGYGPSASCFLKLLAHADQEIWELRCKGIRPQIRVFGRFLSKNVLFLSHYDSRTDLNFEENKKDCVEHWQSLFGDLLPFSGNTFNDYLDDPIYQVTPRPEPRRNTARGKGVLQKQGKK